MEDRGCHLLEDWAARELQLLNVDPDGALGDHGSDVGQIPADGNYVAFSSSSSNLVPDDTNGVPDVFVRGPLG